MSIKNEVNKLTAVYQNLLKEDYDISGYSQSPEAPEDPGMTDEDNISHAMVGDNESMMPMPSPTEDTNKGMAKSEVFKLTKAAQNLMQLLMGSGSCGDIEPWMLSKITKAADYICAVNSALEYDEFEKMGSEMGVGMSELGGISPVTIKIKDLLAGEPLGVNEDVLKQVIFNIECLKEAKETKKKEHKTCAAAKKGCTCSKCAQCKSNKNKKK
jgi:hypothetical protein